MAPGEHVRIIVAFYADTGWLLHRKIEPHTPLAGLMAEVARISCLPISSLRFLVDGERISGASTVSSCELKHDDTIDAMLEQGIDPAAERWAATAREQASKRMRLGGDTEPIVLDFEEEEGAAPAPAPPPQPPQCSSTAAGSSADAPMCLSSDDEPAPPAAAPAAAHPRPAVGRVLAAAHTRAPAAAPQRPAQAQLGPLATHLVQLGRPLPLRPLHALAWPHSTTVPHGPAETAFDGPLLPSTGQLPSRAPPRVPLYRCPDCGQEFKAWSLCRQHVIEAGHADASNTKGLQQRCMASPPMAPPPMALGCTGCAAGAPMSSAPGHPTHVPSLEGVDVSLDEEQQLVRYTPLPCPYLAAHPYLAVLRPFALLHPAVPSHPAAPPCPAAPSHPGN